jgi:hypothetical protein
VAAALAAVPSVGLPKLPAGLPTPGLGMPKLPPLPKIGPPKIGVPKLPGIGIGVPGTPIGIGF